MNTTPALSKTTSRVNGDIAINVFDAFWILRDGDDIDIYTVDAENDLDDVTLGGRVETVWSPEDAVAHCGYSVFLDDASRDRIVAWLS